MIVQARRGEARRQSDSRAQGHAQRRAPARARPATSAATAWPAATSSPSTIRPTSTWCRRSRPASSRSAPTPSCARCGLGRKSRHRRALSRSRDAGRRRSARPLRGGRLRLRAERRAAADVEIAPVSRLASPIPAASSAAISSRTSPAASQCFLNDLIGKPATNDEGFLDHAYVPSFMHTRKRDYARSFGAQFNYQNRRAVGWARVHAGLRQGLQAVGQGALSGVPHVLALRRDAAQQAELRRSGLREARRSTACRWRAATSPGAKTTRRFSRDMQRWSAEILKSAGAEIPRRLRRARHQSRTGRLPHGRRSAHVGGERRLPHARRAESLRGGWQRVPLGVGEESDPHHHGAGRARGGSHRRTECAKEKHDEMETRRETLKIIGAIGTTCAFPFSANDLYGQHQHVDPPAQIAPRGPYTAKFFTRGEFASVSRVADLIIPPTDTPGAVAAGVPGTSTTWCTATPEHQKLMREGLTWLDQQASGKRFVELTRSSRSRSDAAQRSGGPRSGTIPARALLPHDQEHDRRRLLHVANRPGPGTRLQRQHRARILSRLQSPGALRRGVGIRACASRSYNLNMSTPIRRRDLLRGASALTALSYSRVLGANDRSSSA